MMLRGTSLNLATAALAALLIAPVSAAAADLPVRGPSYKAPIYQAPPPIWAGFYIGINAGYGFGNTTVTFSGPAAAALPALGLPTSLAVSPKGFIAGVQAGYNWQWGRFVFGPEIDFDYSAIKGSASASGTVGPLTTTITGSQRINWFGTARARLGFTLWDALLIYGTGGLAYGQTKLEGTVASSAGLALSSSTSKWAFGYTFGGGLEYALFQSWSVKAEYLYYDLGKRSIDFTTPGGLLTATAPFKGHIVRGGLNYHF